MTWMIHTYPTTLPYLDVFVLRVAGFESTALTIVVVVHKKTSKKKKKFLHFSWQTHRWKDLDELIKNPP